MSAEGHDSRVRRWRSWLETTATLAFIAVCGTLVWSTVSAARTQPPAGPPRSASARRPEPPLPKEPLSLDGAALRGSRTAKIALIEYSDFKCPYCGKFARETFPALDDRYVRSGKVLVAFRHLPLAIHPEAQKAAEAAACGGQQGKFWEMHDRLFRSQDRLDLPGLRESAQAVGLNASQFASCLEGQMTDRVQQDAAGAKSLVISGTPTFLVGLVQPDGRVKIMQRLVGAQPPQQFQQVLDRLLAPDLVPSAR